MCVYASSCCARNFLGTAALITTAALTGTMIYLVSKVVDAVKNNVTIQLAKLQKEADPKLSVGAISTDFRKEGCAYRFTAKIPLGFEGRVDDVKGFIRELESSSKKIKEKILEDRTLSCENRKSLIHLASAFDALAKQAAALA